MNRFAVTVAALLVGASAASAEENPLNRDEVSVIKKKMVAVLDALGQAPAGYTVESENFNLPTEAYKDAKSGKYQPVYGSADRHFGTQKSAEKSSKDLQKEYEKKMLEAQAKGDYQAMAALGQEMQKKSSEQQLKASQGRKEPIEVSLQLNSNPGTTIDPDAVLFERPGVIALKVGDRSDSEKSRVAIHFDPVSLKDTKQLSRVDLKKPEGGVAGRTTVLSISVDISGPTAEVEQWAKKIDTKKVLAQIDAR